MGRGWAFIPVLALAWLATTCAGQAIPINEPDCVTVQSPEEVLEAVQAGSRAATVCVPQGRSKCVAVLEIDTSYRERGSTWPRLYFPVQLHHASSVHRLCCVRCVKLCQRPGCPRLADVYSWRRIFLPSAANPVWTESRSLPVEIRMYGHLSCSLRLSCICCILLTLLCFVASKPARCFVRAEFETQQLIHTP